MWNARYPTGRNKIKCELLRATTKFLTNLSGSTIQLLVIKYAGVNHNQARPM